MNRIFRCGFNGYFVNRNVYPSFRFRKSSVICRKNLHEARRLEPHYQSIADFYAGKSVFLTGATGFVGSLLVERLLYTCKDLKKVYILVREKKYGTAQQRLQELLQNPIFTKLKQTRPEDIKKIVPIAGDIGDDRLGLNLEDEQTLIEKVSVIFHSAANVKFRATLADLMQVNYEGTKNVMKLGKKIKHLDIFIHVATAFQSSEDLVVDEVAYPPLKSVKDVYKTIANHNNDSKEVRILLDKWKNSYMFSKNMAEAYVASDHGNMPTVIVRPSMVTSVYKEPLPGYTDSWVAGSGLLCDIAAGLTRVVYGDKNVNVEIIPVDYVTNFLIVAAAKTVRSKNCNVYNISTAHSNPIKWRNLCNIYTKEGKKHGYVIMPFPMVIFTKVKWAIPVLTFVTQIVPAFIADSWLGLTGRQPRYMKLQKQVTSRVMLSAPVTESSWDIRTTRARELISTLDDQDRLTFPCDPVTINWDEYVPIYCKGVKDYMLGSKK